MINLEIGLVDEITVGSLPYTLAEKANLYERSRKQMKYRLQKINE